MASWLDIVFLNNTIKDYLILIVAVLLILLCKRYLSDYLAGLFFVCLIKPRPKSAGIYLFILCVGRFMYFWYCWYCFSR